MPKVTKTTPAPRFKINTLRASDLSYLDLFIFWIAIKFQLEIPQNTPEPGPRTIAINHLINAHKVSVDLTSLIDHFREAFHIQNYGTIQRIGHVDEQKFLTRDHATIQCQVSNFSKGRIHWLVVNQTRRKSVR